MTVAVGARLGPYEIVGPIGAGGMGEVYRALDPRLGREVAVKVLRAELAPDLDRRRRFEGEARTVAGLNHPHILAVFDVGSHEGAPYLVTEVLEGRPLRDVLALGPLPVGKAVDYAQQIAGGLAAAHARGVIHRDLKPSNLFVTADGWVKILDFGVAKLIEPREGAGATRYRGSTRTDPGTLVGTVGYMSPEQVRGQSADARSDIFALGTVLYEMVSGHRAFVGDTAADTIAAILIKDPAPLSGPGLSVPSALDRIVRRCLEKDPAARFQGAHDLTLALEAVRSSESSRGPRPGRWLVVGAVLAVLGLTAVIALWSRRGTRPVAETGRLVRLTSFEGAELDPALSPDGGTLAFVWDGEGGGAFDLYTQPVEGAAPLRLTRSGSVCCPTWSPDGRSLAFVRLAEPEGTVFTIPAAGGPERRSAALHPWFGLALAWSPDGGRLIYPDRSSPTEPFALTALAMDTLATQVVTRPGPGYLGDAFPTWSPDGKTLAFIRVAASGDALPGDLYLSREGLPEPHRLTFDNALIGGLDWSADGRTLLFAGVRKGEEPHVFWVSVDGDPGRPTPVGGLVPREILAETASRVSHDLRLAVSRRSGRIAYVRGSYDTNIWRMANPLRGGSGAPQRLIASSLPDEAPQISPDGATIAFATSRSGHGEIWTCRRDGSRCAALTRSGVHSGTPRWSPDGRQIAFDSRPEGQSDIFVIDLASQQTRRVTASPADDVVPSWSTDGRTIYFASNRTAAWEVWKTPDRDGSPSALTSQGGFAAFESGDAVYFTKHDQPGLWRVAKTGGDATRVAAGPPCWGHWALGRNGLYFLDTATGGRTSLAFLAFGAAAPVRIGSLPLQAPCAESSLAVSPDERDILYVAANESADIVEADLPR